MHEAGMANDPYSIGGSVSREPLASDNRKNSRHHKNGFAHHRLSFTAKSRRPWYIMASKTQRRHGLVAPVSRPREAASKKPLHAPARQALGRL
jgi:hypothetical protein